MAEINYEQVEQFAGLFTEGDVPKFPQHRDDLKSLNDTQRLKLRAAMPDLWQSLHGGNEANLPADVLLRMHKQQLKKGDEVHLKNAGLEAAAIELESRVREEEIQASFKRMQEESERRAAQQEAREARQEADRLASLQMQQLQSKAARGGY